MTHENYRKLKKSQIRVFFIFPQTCCAFRGSYVLEKENLDHYYLSKWPPRVVSIFSKIHKRIKIYTTWVAVARKSTSLV